MVTIEREKLAQWQLSKIEKNRIKIETGVRVVEIGAGWIKTNSNKKIRFCYLIGADGAASIVRRSLKIPSKNISIALQYLIPNTSFCRLETYFNSKLFRSGYAWIFPHKNYTSVGCVCGSKYLSSKDLQKNFHIWLKRKEIDFSRGERQAFPINVDYRGHQFGNIFLAGDAAGLASELTGEGILPATISGETVAELILGEIEIAEKKIKEILSIHNFHKKTVNFFGKLGYLQGVAFQLTALLLRHKRIVKIFLEKIY